jgi:hypothetical protein
MKVHEEDFSKAIVVVKNCSIKVTQTLISKLPWWFLEQEVRIMYPQY